MVELYIPYPPTVNTLFQNNGNGKGRRRSDKYNDWIEEALAALKSQVKNLRPINYPCEIVISAVKPDNKRRDVANIEKATTDLMVKAGVLEDDDLIQRNTQEWVKGDFECRVVIIPIGSFTPATSYLKTFSPTELLKAPT